MYLDMGDEAAGEPRVERLISFEHENQTALDGSIVWKALVEAARRSRSAAFSGKALIHNLRDDDYGRPLDEVRDLSGAPPDALAARRRHRSPTCHLSSRHQPDGATCRR